jgi:hypothetical protein
MPQVLEIILLFIEYVVILFIASLNFRIYESVEILGNSFLLLQEWKNKK